MLRPKKAIPSLAAAILALTGAGCGEDDDNGGGGSSGTDGTGATGGTGGTGGTSGANPITQAAIDAFCMKVVECYPEYPYDYCQYYYSPFAYLDGYPVECVELVQSYFLCGSRLSCMAFIAEPNPCEAALDVELLDQCFGAPQN